MSPTPAGQRLPGVGAEKIPFTVDAALLSELGERLIGQPHIALAELIKNAYDADATICRVAFGLDDIIVSDNGHGMGLETFRSRWMRVGTTHKAKTALSPIGRPLTGSKGVGRLAVQYLADELVLESKSEADATIVAMVDWTQSQSVADLTQVMVEVEESPATDAYPGDAVTGTSIVLTKLRSAWDTKDIEALGRAVWLLRSPFRRRGKSGLRPKDDFEVEFEAEGIPDAKRAFDAAMKDVLDTWRARIVGRLKDGRSGGSLELSVDFKAGYGATNAERFEHKAKLPIATDEGVDPVDKSAMVDEARFEILVFRPEGRQEGQIAVGQLRDFLWKFGNVSIYDVGFRLPYYGAEHDWLDLGRDQARRLDSSELLPASLKIDARYMLDLPSTGRLFGAVEISTAHERSIARRAATTDGDHLEVQVGRDRLIDNRAFRQLATLIRFAIHFYANRYRVRSLSEREIVTLREPPIAKQRRALETLDRYRNAMPTAVYEDVRQDVSEALDASEQAEELADRRVGLLAPLASAGMAALAINHELARETHMLAAAARKLRRSADTHALPELAAIADDLDQSRLRLDSLQRLFAPLLSDADKAATNRLKVRAVIDQTIEAMRILLPGIAFDISVPGDLLFPVGSLAEWNAVLQNVLSNAWNAMLDNGGRRIGLRGGRGARSQAFLRISDAGRGLGIALEEASVLFEPFQRRLEIANDLRSMALGGQGLGLAIVRMIATRRGVKARFVEPEPSFATTFELTWRD